MDSSYITNFRDSNIINMETFHNKLEINNSRGERVDETMKKTGLLSFNLLDSKKVLMHLEPHFIIAY